MASINQGMAKGAFWMVLFRMTTRGIGLINTILLARLLAPADFGLVAMAMTLIAAFELMGAFSLDVVLIQKREATSNDYDTAWTFNVIAATLQGLLLALLAHTVANFYHDPRLVWVIWCLALGVFVQGFENIGIVAFRKDMAFHRDFWFQVSKKMISFVITVTLALLFRNYWALIGGTLASRFIGVIFSFWIQSYRPSFCLASRHQLFHFSKWLFINNMLFFAMHQSANFILGKLSGSQALGEYSIAYEISNLPSTDLIAPINRAIFPGYAQMSHDLAQLRQGFLTVFSAIAMAALPICTMIAILASPLVHVLLGDQWLSTIPLIQILAIAGLVQALQTNKGSVYLAMGRPRILTLLAALHVLFVIPAITWGAYHAGMLGAAIATALVPIGLMPINFAILFHILKLPLRPVLAVLWRPLLATGIMSGSVWWALHLLPIPHHLLGYMLSLLAPALVGGVVYVGMLWGSWRLAGCPEGMEQILLKRLMKNHKPHFNA